MFFHDLRRALQTGISRQQVHGRGHTTTTLVLMGRWPSLAIRMAEASRVLMRGLAANFAGKAWRQVGQVFLPCATHLLKHPKQKLCWQGACRTQFHANVLVMKRRRELTCERSGEARLGYRHRSGTEVHAHGTLQGLVKYCCVICRFFSLVICTIEASISILFRVETQLRKYKCRLFHHFDKRHA